jgi:hypothetical protein
MDLPKSPSIKVALTVSSVSRLALRSKSLNERNWAQLATLDIDRDSIARRKCLFERFVE